MKFGLNTVETMIALSKQSDHIPKIFSVKNVNLHPRGIHIDLIAAHS